MFICKICELQYNSKSDYNKYIRTKYEKKRAKMFIREIVATY